MSIREFLVLLLVCCIWGLHFVVMKLTVNGTAEPIFYAAVRMSLVALVLLPKLKWHKGLMPLILCAGLAYGALNYAFMFPALKLTTASAAAVTIELYVPFSIILSVIVFKDHIGAFKLAGIALALIGVAIVSSGGPDETAGPYFLIGILLMACAAMSEAVGAVLVKKIRGVKPIELVAWFAVVGTAVLWPLTLILEDNQMTAFSADNRMAFGFAILYSALLVSVVAHTSYYWLLQRLPIYIVSTSGLMTTLIAVVASILVLNESLTTQFIIGGLMTLAGVGLILWRNQKMSKSSPTLPQ